MPKGVYEHEPHTEERKKNISKALKGRKITWGDKIAKSRTKSYKEGKWKHGRPSLGKERTLEERKKISEGLKRAYREKRRNPEDYSHKISDKHKGKKLSEEHRLKLSESHKGQIQTEESKFKNSEEIKKCWKDGRKQLGDHNFSKKKWSDNNYRKKQLKKIFEGIQVKPNKPEKIMLNIIKDNNLPFNYVGDGRIWFRGENHSFNPDFLSKNPKHIIEVFGDYWHNRDDMKKRDEERLKTYSKYGYKTLVIWENELKNIPTVLSKIRRFLGP